jgi:hypothetical protein
LKEERNRLVPVCRFPVEVLVRIFGHHQLTRHRDGKDSIEQYLSENYNNKWMGIMLVCRHFRSVAVNAPELWNILFSDEIESRSIKTRLDVCAARSGILPLVLIGGNKKLQQLLPQAITADLRLIPGYNFGSSKLHQSAPFLQDLCLRHNFSVDINLIGGRSTTLARLSLDDVMLLSLPSLPSLTYLSLKDVIMDNDLDWLVRSLKQTPSLEVLVVTKLHYRGIITLPREDKVISQWERVNLVKLRVLQVHDNAPLTSAVLRIVSASSLALHVKVIRRDEEHQSFHLTLNENHDAIFERCLDSWRSSSPAAPRPVCTLCYSFDRESKYRPVVASAGYLQLGDPFDLDKDGDVQDISSAGSAPYLFVSIDCVVTERHACLQHVTDLHLTSDGQPHNVLHDPINNLGLQYLPINLDRLIIECYVSEEDLSPIETVILRGRALRASHLSPPSTQTLITIQTLDCSKAVQNFIDSWLTVPALRVKEVIHA